MHAVISHPIDHLAGQPVIPGDKSISHRALIFAAIRLGTTTITGLLEGEDVLNTAKALEQLGVPIERLTNGDWRVDGVGLTGLQAPKSALDMGNSGTGARLMMGLLAGTPFNTLLTGDESLQSRPMQRVMTPLELMGTEFTTSKGGQLPLTVNGTAHLHAIEYTLPVASAQVKSAILLAALNAAGTTTVVEPTATRDHTENMLAGFGFAIERSKGAIHLTGGQQPAASDVAFSVPADPSSAAFATVGALICAGSNVTIKGVCLNPLRAGIYVTLKEMGAAIEYYHEREEAGERVADLKVATSALQGVSIPAARAPSMIDEYPILAVAAAFASGDTVMHGLEELKVKESDRLQAIIDGLNACGVKTTLAGDTLTVHGTGGNVPGGGAIECHHDHRIAMSFLVLGMASKQPVTIDDDASIATSFPTFIELMNGLGARIFSPPLEGGQTQTSEAKSESGGVTRSPATTPHTSSSTSTSSRLLSATPPQGGSKKHLIAIDGPAASGKGTLARKLAQHFGLKYLDTGSLYRAVGHKLLEENQQPQDEAAAITAAKTLDMHDLTSRNLRQEKIGNAASIISAYPKVREILLQFQRDFAASPKGAVLDGRDIGTVVCPSATHKFYLTASIDARAKRRHAELQGNGVEVVYASVVEDLKERDARDANRPIAPLKPAHDAIHIDTSNMDAATVFEEILTQIKKTD